MVEYVRPGALPIEWKLETADELWQARLEVGQVLHITQNIVLYASTAYRAAAQNSSQRN